MQNKQEASKTIFEVKDGNITDGKNTFSLEQVVSMMNNDQTRLAQFNELINLIPECDSHGSDCISNAKEWINEKLAEDSNNPAVEAMRFVFESDGCEDDYDRVNFLRLWFNADFPEIREAWEDVPDEVFIGADPLFVKQE